MNHRDPRYIAYMNSREWRLLRAYIVRRDNGRCQHTKKGGAICGYRKRLEVHHKTYVRFGNEHPDDLITVCARCHAAIHRRYKNGKK